MSEPRGFHRSATTLMSAAMTVIGVAIVVRTFAAGGSIISVGVLLGLLFAAAGALRLYAEYHRG